MKPGLPPGGFRRSWGFLTVALLSAAAGAGQTPAATPPGGLRSARLYEMVTSRSLGNVNRADAQAALKGSFDIIARQKGFVLDSRVDVADSVTEIRERLRNHSVDVIALSTPEYLELEPAHLTVPLMAPGWNGRSTPLYSYVLLVSPLSRASGIEALRGKSLLEFSRTGSNAGALWVDVALAKGKLGRAASFFASLKQPATAQNCILPVFFGAADACVVDEIDFDLAKEMNPQLGQMRILARSRPLLDGLIATRLEPVPYRKELLDALLALHEDPRGRQMLMVFKTERLVPVEPGDLDSARELWREFERLPAANAGRGTLAERAQERH